MRAAYLHGEESSSFVLFFLLFPVSFRLHVLPPLAFPHSDVGLES
jgi:hypothetical protein